MASGIEFNNVKILPYALVFICILILIGFLY